MAYSRKQYILDKKIYISRRQDVYTMNSSKNIKSCTGNKVLLVNNVLLIFSPITFNVVSVLRAVHTMQKSEQLGLLILFPTPKIT